MFWHTAFKSVSRVFSGLKGLFLRLGKPKSTTWVFVALIVGIVLWMLSGILKDKTEDQGIPLMDKTLHTVEVKTFEKEDASAILNLFGRTEAKDKMVIKSRIRGEIEQIFAESGSILKEGDLIMKFKERSHTEFVKAATAQLKKAEIAYKGRVKLAEKELISEMDVASSMYDLESAKAGLAEAQFELENLIVQAPFSGFIEKIFVKKGEYVTGPGNRLAHIIHLDQFFVISHISEDEIQFVRNADRTSGKIKNFEKVDLTLKSISTTPNPATNTFRVEFSFKFASHLGDRKNLKEGLSTQVSISGKNEEATKIPIAIFSLSDDGVLGVRGVDKDDAVVFFPIKILREEDGFAWVSGIPSNASIIVTGFESVVEGSKVRVGNKSPESIQ